MTLDELTTYIGATDIYLTPYRNPAQSVSGALSYVVGNGRAIISTPYWYAEELLADYAATATDGWRWFETRLTYDNARLPQALLLAAGDLGRADMGAAALDALGWLDWEQVTSVLTDIKSGLILGIMSP